MTTDPATMNAWAREQNAKAQPLTADELAAYLVQYRVHNEANNGGHGGDLPVLIRLAGGEQLHVLRVQMVGSTVDGNAPFHVELVTHPYPEDWT